MLTVVVKFTIKPDCIDAIRAVFLELVEYSRKAEGCESYEFFRDSKTPNLFVLIENWVSEEAVNAHVASDYIQQARGVIGGGIVGEPEILVLERVG